VVSVMPWPFYLPTINTSVKLGSEDECAPERSVNHLATVLPDCSVVTILTANTAGQPKL